VFVSMSDDVDLEDGYAQVIAIRESLTLKHRFGSHEHMFDPLPQSKRAEWYQNKTTNAAIEKSNICSIKVPPRSHKHRLDYASVYKMAIASVANVCTSYNLTSTHLSRTSSPSLRIYT
jgi:hypothetical protein